MRTPASAQRTLNARRDEYDNASASSMPAGHLSIASLGSLLDQAKTLPAGASRRQVYEDYGLDEQTMEEMRKWVNSVSVGAGVEVRLVDGEEVREMLVSLIDALLRITFPRDHEATCMSDQVRLSLRG